MEIDHEVLLARLSRLKLTAIRDRLDSLLDEAARREMTLREALAFLCEREVARKDERRIEMGLKIAHFPCVRDLDGFDFTAQPSVDPRQIRELATCRWVANGESLLLGQVAPRHRPGPRGDPPEPFGAVRRRPGPGGGAGQGPCRVEEGQGGAQKEGLGLGLAIVATRAKLLNGRVTVQSRLGRGSVFSFILPLGATEPAPG